MNKKRQALVTQYTKYVKNWAFLFASRVNMLDALEDIEAAALVGLCEAAETYKVSKKTKFVTWYYWHVLGAMQNYAKKAGRPVHDHAHGISQEQRRKAEVIEATKGRPATAEELGTTEKKLKHRTGVDLVAWTDIGASGSQELLLAIKELPRREQHILMALAKGDSRAQIAKRFGMRLVDLNEKIEEIRGKLV